MAWRNLKSCLAEYVRFNWFLLAWGGRCWRHFSPAAFMPPKRDLSRLFFIIADMGNNCKRFLEKIAPPDLRDGAVFFMCCRG